MRNRTVLSAATIVAALWLSGCSHSSDPAPASSPTTSTLASGPQAGALPAPEVLTDVLGKLADPAVAGRDKLPLVEGATADEATDLDNFTKALQDNRMLPLTFAATNLVWSDDEPGNVTATVTVTPAGASVPGFTFPMEFTSGTAGSGWQLSRKTADLLFTFGAKAEPPTTQAVPPPAAPAPPQPTPTR